MTTTKAELSDTHGEFVSRHIGPRQADIDAMLAALKAGSLEELIGKVVPKAIRTGKPLNLPRALSEQGALKKLAAMAAANEAAISMIGMGYYGTLTPTVILRNVLENPGWYTAYTPYQAEVSQGRLEALLNFQQMVCDMTGLELASASLLDEGTAAAEAMAMAHRAGGKERSVFFVDADTHPQTIAILKTRARGFDFDLVIGDPESDLDAGKVFAALLSYPGSGGAVRDIAPVIERLHEADALAIVASDLLALALIKAPGEFGADIAIGSAQRFGVPMGFGGPHAAFLATRDEHKRALPGRIIGVSVDKTGKPALRMALQTREQHIRREKATSNICTAQVLLAIMAGFYAVYHGAGGIRAIARRVHGHARALAAGLAALGFEPVNDSYFDTLTVKATGKEKGKAKELVERAREAGVNLRLVDADHFAASVDETTGREDLDCLLSALGGKSVAEAKGEAIPEALRRDTGFLTHPVFSACRSETEMLRYLRLLQGKDIALDRAMIPLGSCTMKLNATTEMIPVTWGNFGNIHPFAPAAQTAGYRELFGELEAALCEITGFDAVSLQPNAGSQGEYAGLLCIRKFHEAAGEGGRDICLIPASAHGTNPASAVMAGLKVVVVACDRHGNVDVDDLKKRAGEHADRLAALMITYPSTHGVFETAIRDICKTVHDHGGQVYLDGANLNALVGLVRLAEIGADVCHMNLHKTFCIPHGGGGPGVGPIGVKSHLSPFLPDHAVVEGVNPAAVNGTIGQVSAAPWGSASILPISWSYIAMMGGNGLTRASEVAILSANYMSQRLGAHYPVLYTGPGGMVAHECIIDIRQIKEACGITAEDIAKRLVDYGFHAPTMSFPVPETLMIEPTESEPRAEIDRFCDAMIAIRAEIAEVESGTADRDNNILRNAPHTAELLMEDWALPYERERAYYPLGSSRADKFWPPVARVDNVYGDRHLACTCPPVESYKDAAE